MIDALQIGRGVYRVQIAPARTGYHGALLRADGGIVLDLVAATRDGALTAIARELRARGNRALADEIVAALHIDLEQALNDQKVTAMPTTIPADVQRKLYEEADARFRAQTGIVRKLDPKSLIDKALIPIWADVYAKVLRDWRAGTITWTHDHPIVQQALTDAAAATAAAAASMVAAAGVTAAGGPREAVEQHMAAAQDARAAATVATAAAAQVQPPTVSPAHVATAAHQVTQFVMDASGRGRQVSGSDAVTALQAAAAPAKITQALGDMAPSDLTALVEADRASAASPAPAKSSRGTAILVGAGVVVAAVTGVLMYRTSRPAKRGGGGGLARRSASALPTPRARGVA